MMEVYSVIFINLSAVSLSILILNGFSKVLPFLSIEHKMSKSLKIIYKDYGSGLCLLSLIYIDAPITRPTSLKSTICFIVAVVFGFLDKIVSHIPIKCTVR